MLSMLTFVSFVCKSNLGIKNRGLEVTELQMPALSTIFHVGWTVKAD